MFQVALVLLVRVTLVKKKNLSIWFNSTQDMGKNAI
jgi:hypothetical protein